MERTQFTFYESFAKALKRIKKDTDRAKAYDTICDYALYGVEPDYDKLPDSSAIAFDLIRPVLDAGKKKAESGKLGGKRKKNGSTEEANGSKAKANGSKTPKSRSEKEDEIEDEKEDEIEGEVEIEVEVEKESLPSGGGGGRARVREEPVDSPYDPEYGRVMTFFMDKINPTPSPMCIAALADYTKRLTADVVLHGLNIALDERNYHWSYIQGILQRYSREGLNTMDAVLRSEQEFAAHRNSRGKWGVGQGSASPPSAASGAMDDLRALHEMFSKGDGT